MPVSNSSGTSSITMRVPAAAAASIFSSSMRCTSGWMMPSSARRWGVLWNTMSASAARSSVPSGRNTPSPKLKRMAGSAAPPGAVTAREAASASNRAAPRASRYLAASVLPLPVEPVRPMT